MKDVQTGEDVLTHHGTDRRHRLCLCSVCKEVQRCVPANDFYATGDVPEVGPRPLICSGCFRKSLTEVGLEPEPWV